MAAWSLAGCAGPLSALDPAGPSARGSAWLFWVMLATAVAIALLVYALLFAAMRRRRAIAAGDPGDARARRWILGGGVAFPLVVLVLLLAATLAVGERQFVRDDGLPVVRATASQWIWRFAEVAADGTVGPQREVLLLRAGQPTIVELASDDVIHGFWVPRLGGKMDAVPGIVNRHLLEADVPGTYDGTCAEYCGTGHDRMRFRVLVVAADADADAVADALRAERARARPAAETGTPRVPPPGEPPR